MEETKEEIKTEEKKEEINNTEIDVLAEAQKVNAEMKKQNEIKAKLLDREEKLLARQETLRSLGGGSQVGKEIKPETADEKWAREAKLRYAGTGYDPT